MNPDISYIFDFEKSRKKQAIESLKEFCINTEEGNYNPALISDGCFISFIVDIEEPLNWYYESHEHSRRIKGKIVIDSIQLWIRGMQNETIFEFWPPASSTGKACLASKNLYNAFIRFLENNNGAQVKLDHSNGFIETIYTNPHFGKKKDSIVDGK